MACHCGYNDTDMIEHVHGHWHYPVCASCDKAFADPISFVQHARLKKHSMTSLPAGVHFLCACGFLAIDFDRLKSHRESKKHLTYYARDTPKTQRTSDRPLLCGVCEFLAESLKAPQKHVAVHPRCEECHSSFRRQRDVRDHKVQTGHCYCGTCSEAFPTPVALAQHEANTHATDFKCMDCDRCFRTEASLMQHLKDKTTIHEKLLKRSKKRKDGSIKCCKREFKTFAAVQDHQSSQRHKDAVKAASRSRAPTQPTGIVCPLNKSCKRRFETPSALVMHLESGSRKYGMDRAKFCELVGMIDEDRVVPCAHVTIINTAAVEMVDRAKAVVAADALLLPVSIASHMKVSRRHRLLKIYLEPWLRGRWIR
ncbi:hypothetical protein LTR53_001135, partial [Teratosphaeriaceae sp. CCFEE 6253]